MVYNKDPILPFEYADRSDNLTHDHDGLHKSCDDIWSSESSDDVDPISKLLERLEKQREILSKGWQKIFCGHRITKLSGITLEMGLENHLRWEVKFWRGAWKI